MINLSAFEAILAGMKAIVYSFMSKNSHSFQKRFKAARIAVIRKKPAINSDGWPLSQGTGAAEANAPAAALSRGCRSPRFGDPGRSESARHAPKSAARSGTPRTFASGRTAADEKIEWRERLAYDRRPELAEAG